MEQWKQIDGWPYYISNQGRIKDMKGNIKVLQLNKGKAESYQRVRLYNKGNKQKFYVHRLVGQYFVDGYDSNKNINHKDGNPLNNVAENLEWVTQSENVKHWHTELKNKKIC